MKKFIAAVAVLSLVATPALAEHRDNRWGVDSNRNSPYYGRQVGYERHEHLDRGGVSNGDAVAIGLGALLLGGIIGSRSTEERYRNPPQMVVVPSSQIRTFTVCEPDHYLRDQYGNIIRDQYGNAIVVPQRCWHQY